VQVPSQGQRLSGFLQVPEGTLMVVADPILRSGGTGTSQGAFVVGRYLTQADLDAVRRRSRLLSLSMRPVDPVTNAAQVDQLVVKPISSSELVASTAAADIFGRPSFHMEVAVDRQTYQQALIGFQYMIMALVGLGGFFLVLTLVLLETLVLRRLARVSRQVREIGTSKSLSRRLDVTRSDEVDEVARAINQMLDDLQAAQLRERELKKQATHRHFQDVGGIDEAERDRAVAEVVEANITLIETVRRQRSRMAHAVRGGPRPEFVSLRG